MSVSLILIMPPTGEMADKLVRPEYVAELFGCSVASVRRGKCGTKDMPRWSSRPLRFQRAKVHEVYDRLSQEKKSAKERALSLVNRTGKPRRGKAA